MAIHQEALDCMLIPEAVRAATKIVENKKSAHLQKKKNIVLYRHAAFGLSGITVEKQIGAINISATISYCKDKKQQLE